MALPVSPGSTDRRHDIVQLLSASPHGLSDADLARALDAAVRPQTVNQLCRRMVAEGTLERVGTRPILNRLVPADAAGEGTIERAPASGRKKASRRTAAVEEIPAATSTPPESAEAPPEPEATDAAPEPEATDTAPEPEAPRHADAPTNGTAHSSEIGVPAHDITLAWSRTANVLAAVARWLTLHGGTIRSATPEAAGPARDLVASLDGDEIHVEITGWPADGARTHPTTIAGDWFTAAEHAAAERRRTHPGARIVIALPDTRRYRSLSRHRAAALAGARAEVWFVDPAGSVHPHTGLPTGSPIG